MLEKQNLGSSMPTVKFVPDEEVLDQLGETDTLFDSDSDFE